MRAELIRKGVKPQLFRIVSNPEFLREGSAVYDMFHPDKIVVGLEPDDDQSLAVMQAVYAGINAPYLTTSLTGAELIKYAANAFLATKISFINEMARICDAFAVDVNDIARGIGLDPRIGRIFCGPASAMEDLAFQKISKRSNMRRARAKWSRIC
ncbi:UDP-glucose 6-dehydrogenase [Geobacillus sp. WSUCF1]|nr:UDP-glucose 6-dehydrogenase [Geobacillus sp. WSUCF1]